jgi:hypothetical protein
VIDGRVALPGHHGEERPSAWRPAAAADRRRWSTSKAPWLDREEPAVESETVELREPGESILGCRFLAALAGETDLFYEPIDGSVRLQPARRG